MSRLHDEWKVDAHGPLEHLGDGVWTVAGEISMPLGHFPRRMTVVVLEGARLLVWSAIPMRDAALAQLEALGDVAFLVVPGVAHRLDLRAWKRRSCSSGLTENQYFRTMIPERTSIRSNSGAERKNSLYSSSVQNPITRSTPARLYQLRSKITISPAAGRCST